jgi:hypothetical protein
VAEELPEGLEGYPYASPEAESRIRRVTSALSVLSVGLLAGGLYLLLFTPDRIALGGVMALVGFVALMLVPTTAKRLRAAALRRERGAG